MGWDIALHNGAGDIPVDLPNDKRAPREATLRRCLDHGVATLKVPTISEGDSQIGTVGCVAVDGNDTLAVATSTGGLVNKMVGRIGDTPVIGADTYANTICAVSVTGKGESIITNTIARDVEALMEYRGLSLKEAPNHVIANAPKGTVGLVVVTDKGDAAMPFNTTGMFRACATEDGHSEIAIW